MPNFSDTTTTPNHFTSIKAIETGYRRYSWSIARMIHRCFFISLSVATLFSHISICNISAQATPSSTTDIQNISRIMKSPLGQAVMYLPEWEILSHDLLGAQKAVVRNNETLPGLLKILEQPSRSAQTSTLSQRLIKIESEFKTASTLTLQDHARLERRVQQELQIDFNSPAISRIFLHGGTVIPKFTAAEWYPNNLAQIPLGLDSHYSGSRSVLTFNFPGVQVANIEDSTFSTGATVFFFEKGAIAAYDSRGGSVAAVETTLLDPGSYSADIDAIVLAGGSSMGLDVSSGVRQSLFRARAGKGSAFDSIPSAPGAVVYDYSGRVYAHHDSGIYPSADMGAAAMERLDSKFVLGRAGAGLNTTANKFKEGSKRIWGGQGAAFSENPWGRVLVAVILNPSGDIQVEGKSISNLVGPADALMKAAEKKAKERKAGKNTTLSLIVTDTPLDRNALKRLSMMVHTNMASIIQPFQTYGDGDICFAVTTSKIPLQFNEEAERKIQTEALRLMKQAIVKGALTANLAQEKLIQETLKKLK